MANMALTDKIERYLAAPRFLSGHVIKEKDLARIFNVSTTPVREALKTMETRGLITRRQRAGTTLTPLSVQEYSALYEVRAVLEGLAGRLIVETGTPAIIAKLQALDKRHTAAVKKNDAIAAMKTDIAFHTELVESSGNPILVHIIRSYHVLTRTFRLNYQMAPVSPLTAKNPYSHKKIMQVLLSGNPVKADRMCRLHVEWARGNGIKNILRTQAQCQ